MDVMPNLSDTPIAQQCHHVNDGRGVIVAAQLLGDFLGEIDLVRLFREPPE